MSSFALMNIGARALGASYVGLQTTGNNIANAGVQGYSRQTVNLATAEGQYNAAGFLGRGVDVRSVTRAQDAYLTQEAVTTRSVAAMDDARMSALRRLEEVFPPGELGIGHASGQFLNAMVDLASRPADDSARQVVLARAAEVADRFATASRRMDAIQADVGAALGDAVLDVNALAQSLALANRKIMGTRGGEQAPLNLLDERDRLIGQLAERLNVTTLAQDNGSISVFVGGGRPLVLGDEARALSVQEDPNDPRRFALAIQEAGFSRLVDDATLGAGEMAGLLRFQNEDLVRGRALLGQIGAALSSAVNTQQSYGLDLNGAAGGELFADVLADTAAMVQPAASNGGTVPPTLTIGDAARLKAEEYTLAHDGTQWQLTATFSGQTTDPTDATAMAALGFTVDTTGVNTGDRFLLQPVTYAAGQMRRVLDAPAGIAAASPVVVNPDVGNTGTASVARLQVTSATPSTAFTLTYDDASDEFTVTGGPGGTVAWQPGLPLAVGGIELTLNGRPADGDIFTIAPTTQPRQNNTNALALVALREALLVGRDGNGDGGASITDAYASAMADVGVRVQGSITAAEISAAVADEAELRRSGELSVNLDEEAARLLQFQQAYQASARVLQAAQTIFDTLLQVTR